MRIGIDISQIAYDKTGVGSYVRHIVGELVNRDRANEYVLFGASLRKQFVFAQYVKTLKQKVKLVVVPIPPTVLDILWNVLHIVPVEWFIGNVDVFWSSDWTQPPLSKARGITTIHDVAIFTFPESFHQKIVAVQKRRLRWAKKECERILCDSESTKRDVIHLLGISENKLNVVYPGLL